MNSPAVSAEATSAAPLPRALPAWTYSHPEMTRLEIERILKPSWQIVCHMSAIPRPGDYATFDLGPESVVAVRGSQGQIQAFHNVCRHRAARILDGTGKCPGTITCPYHGWTYRLTGELIGMPVRESFPGLERSQFSLRPVRAELFLGFVFVALSGHPPPLAQVWGDFAQDFTPYRFEEMVPLDATYHEDWDVDWKVAMDNYLESYHVPIGHPGLFRMFTPDFEDQAFRPGIGRSFGWMRDNPSSKWSERLYQRFVGEVAQELPESHRRRWGFYSLLPNLGIDVFPDQMDFFQVLPRGPGKCTIRGGTFGLPADGRVLRAVRYLNARINRSVQREDEFLCRRVQRGLASSSYEPGPLSSLESCVLEFHDLLRARIPEARLANAPSHFA